MEAATYLARCTGVIDRGNQVDSYEGKEKIAPKILLIFEFPTECAEINGELKPRWMTQIFTKSTHEKSKLRAVLKAWRGKDFTPDELELFELANVLNAPCAISISHAERNGNIYGNISSIGAMVKGTPPPQDVVRKYHFDIDDPETWACFTDLPEWIQAKINASETLKTRGIQINKQGEAVDVATKPTVDIEDEEDLPF